MSTYVYVVIKRLKMKTYSLPNHISIEILLLLNLINQNCNLSMAVVLMHSAVSFQLLETLLESISVNLG